MLDKIIKVLVIISWIIGLYMWVSIIAFFWRLSKRYKTYTITLPPVEPEEPEQP